MDERNSSIGRSPLDLRKFRDRVEEVLVEKETASLSELVKMYPLSADCGRVCYRVIAGEDSRHDILRDEVIH